MSMNLQVRLARLELRRPEGGPQGATARWLDETLAAHRDIDIGALDWEAQLAKRLAEEEAGKSDEERAADARLCEEVFTAARLRADENQRQIAASRYGIGALQ